MNFETYLQTVRLRCKSFERADQIVHGQIGMLTELGELGDLIKKAFVYGKAFDAVNLMEECGDYLWYFTLYCAEKRIVSMGWLDGVVESCEKQARSLKFDDSSEKQLLTILNTSSALLIGDWVAETPNEDIVGATESSLMMVFALLAKHGFTVSQCLVANDAKLEARTGKKFDAAAILARDTEAERAILESHVPPTAGAH